MTYAGFWAWSGLDAFGVGGIGLLAQGQSSGRLRAVEEHPSDTLGQTLRDRAVVRTQAGSASWSI